MFHQATRVRQFIAVVLLLCITMMPFAGISAAASDTTGHWAESIMEEAVQKGWVNGYEDGTLRPDQSITRAETAALVNRIFGYKEVSLQTEFKDIVADSWVYTEVSKAVYAGYIKGYEEDNTFRPDEKITREEAAVIVSRLVSVGGEAQASSFADQDKVAEWSRKAVTVAASKGIMKGYEDGSFRPASPITRAEAIAVFGRAMAAGITHYDKPGEYGASAEVKTLKGDVRIAAGSVTLQNLIIEGDLLLDRRIGEGDVYLKQVTVKGRTYVQGGGQNSVYFEDSTLASVVIERKDGLVRVVATGSTSVQAIEVLSAVKVEESRVTGSGFTSIKLGAVLPEGTKVILKGDFDQVDILAAKAVLEVSEGTITKLNVDKGATQTEIALSERTKVTELQTAVELQVTGAGKVEKAVLDEAARNSKFATAPVTIKAPDGSTQSPVSGQLPPPIVVPPTNPNTNPTPSAKTAAPTVTGMVYADMVTINGTAETGATVTLNRRGESLGTVVATDGIYQINLSAPIVCGDTLILTASISGKTASDPVTIIVGASRHASVRVAGVKKLEALFAFAVDPSRITVDVYRTAAIGDQKIKLEPSSQAYSTDGTRVSLEFFNPLPAGDYLVSIGNEYTGGTSSHFLRVERERSSVQFLLDSAVLDQGNPRKAITKYRVNNQYGEDVTTRYMPNLSSTNGTVMIERPGILTINGSADFIVGQEIVLIAKTEDIYISTKKVTIGLTEVPAAEPVPGQPNHDLDTRFEVYGLYHPEQKRLTVDSNLSEYKVLFKLKDRNGNDLTLDAIQSKLVVVNSTLMDIVNLNPLTVESMDLNGTTWAAMTLRTPAWGLSPGTVNLMLVDNKTGAASVVNVVIAARSQPAVMQIQLPANVTAGERTIIPYTVADQFGSAMSYSETVRNGVQFTSYPYQNVLSFNQQGQLILDLTRVAVQAPQYLYLTGTLFANGTLVNTVTTVQPDAISSNPVDVGTVPVAGSIEMSAPPLTVAGEKVEIPFTARDQFGNVLTTYDSIASGIVYAQAAYPGARLSLEKDYLTNQSRLWLDVISLENAGPVSFPVMIFTKGGQISQRTVTVYPKAVPTMITAINMDPRVLAVGAQSSIRTSDIEVADQYMRVKTLDKYNGITAIFSSSNTQAVSVQSNTATPIQNVALAGVSKGEAIITAHLQWPNNSMIAYVQYSFLMQVVDATQIAGYTFSVSGAVYATDSSVYAKRLMVYGQTVEGRRVSVTPNYYSSVTDSVYLVYDPVSRMLRASPGIDLGGAVSKPFQVTFTGQTLDGAKVFTVPVTVSSQPPEPVRLDLRSNGKIVKHNEAIISVPVSELAYLPLQALASKAVKVVDQYGTELVAYPLKVLDDNYPTGKLYPHLNPGDSFSLTVITEQGLSLSFRVIVVV